MAEGGIEITTTGPEAPAPAPTNDRPAWLPENFKTPEDLAKSYQNLQAEYTKLKQGAPADASKPADAPAEVKPNDLTIDQKAAEAVSNAGLDFDKLADEFMAEGKLKDESYQALEKQGIPKTVVDEFIRLKQGEAQTIKGEVLSIAGGEESFQQMVQWAATNYADAAAYNQMITSGDPAQMRMAMMALKSAYVAANGQDPNLVMANNGVTGGDAYESDDEMVADMQKPEYRTDPAFRRMVQEKTARMLVKRG
jgi:hypothetical protein